MIRNLRKAALEPVNKVISYYQFTYCIVYLLTERNSAELALAIVLPLLVLIILAIAAVIVYRIWKKKGKRTRYLAADEEVPMNPVTTEPVSQ